MLGQGLEARGARIAPSSGLAGRSAGGSVALKPPGATSFGVVRMEERRQQLDVPAADPELPLPAAVRADPASLAVVVRLEEPVDGPEPRRLHVDGLRRPAERLDVVAPSGSARPR